MSTFDETTVRRGQPENAGQFRAKVATAPSGALTTDVALDDHGIRALSHYGLTEKDVPGFSVIWERTFAPLSEEPSPWPIHAATEALGLDLDDVDDISGMRREDDGSVSIDVELSEHATVDRSAHPGYDDVNDTWSIRAGDTADRVLASWERRDERRAYEQLKGDRAMYASGRLPAWHILLHPDELSQVRRSYSRAVVTSRLSADGDAESAAQDRYWAAGWPGPADALPPRPNSTPWSSI